MEILRHLREQNKLRALRSIARNRINNSLCRESVGKPVHQLPPAVS